MLRNLLFFVILIFPFISQSQEFGGFPPSKKWLQLKNENYRIIFSPENESTARGTAAVISKMNNINPNIGIKRREINLVLQNSTTQSNGYVGLAPFVSEFYLTPFPNSFQIGSLPWPYTLGVHEYQHVLQYSNSYYGLSKIAYWLGGEQLWGAFQVTSIPNWFFEGDAVRAETEYSQQGRGRIPAFLNGFRAFALNDSIPGYEKVRNGSIRDYVPNHYPLGYLMIKYGREKYGKTYWPSVLKDAAAYRTVFYPFSGALKRNGGERVKNFYGSMMRDFSTHWQKEETEFGQTLYTVKKHEVSNDQFPQFDVDSSLYYYNSTYDRIGYFYQLKNGKQIQHCSPGIRNENYFSVNHGKIMFTQTYFDKRWGWIDYQDIVIYDTGNRKRKRLTKKGKYFHPSFSPDGSKIIVQYVYPDHTFELQVLNAENGAIIEKIDNPNNFYYTYPVWKNDVEIVSATRDSIGQMFLTFINLQNNSVQETERSFHPIGKPFVQNNRVYYSSGYSGVDNIYAYENGINFQVSKGGKGRYNPVVKPGTDSLYFVEFTLSGTRLKTAVIQGSNEFQPPQLNELDFYNPEYMANSKAIDPTISNDSLEATKYSKLSHPINIHSWSLLFGDPEVEFSLASDNILNTLDVSAGYKYNLNENKGGVFAAATYSQYYLHLNASVSRIGRSFERINAPDIEFNETQTSLGLGLPLNFSSGMFSRRLSASTSYDYLITDFNSETYVDQNIHSSKTQLVYAQQKLKARKNIFTHLGVYSRTLYRQGIGKNANQLLTQNSLAINGLSHNHNLVFDLDGQIDLNYSDYIFSDLFQYPRGFQNFRFANMYKFSGNYHFPLFYPDKGALGILYLLRIRANIFADYNYVKIAEPREFTSTGGELIFDAKFLNLFPFSIGLRYTRILSAIEFSESGNENVFEVFIPFSRF